VKPSAFLGGALGRYSACEPIAHRRQNCKVGNPLIAQFSPQAANKALILQFMKGMGNYRQHTVQKQVGVRNGGYPGWLLRRPEQLAALAITYTCTLVALAR
jgi:hypothetical protein